MGVGVTAISRFFRGGFLKTRGPVHIALAYSIWHDQAQSYELRDRKQKKFKYLPSIYFSVSSLIWTKIKKKVIIVKIHTFFNAGHKFCDSQF